MDITEQEIFDDSNSTRLKYLKHILKNPTSKELEFIKSFLEIEKNVNIKNSIIADINSIIIGNCEFKDEVKEILELLRFAPIPFLQNLIIKLRKMKELSEV